MNRKPSRVARTFVPMLAVAALAACSDQRTSIVSATLCLTPPEAANATFAEMTRRLTHGGYGDVSKRTFGAEYVDLSDTSLRPRVTCCGKERSFGTCAAGSTPVDLFIDTSRVLTETETIRLRRQLDLELTDARDAVVTGR